MIFEVSQYSGHCQLFEDNSTTITNEQEKASNKICKEIDLTRNTENRLNAAA